MKASDFLRVNQNRFAGDAEFYERIVPTLGDRQFRKFSDQVVPDPEDSFIANAQRLSEIKSALTGQNVDRFTSPSERTSRSTNPRGTRGEAAMASADLISGKEEYLKRGQPNSRARGMQVAQKYGPKRRVGSATLHGSELQAPDADLFYGKDSTNIKLPII